MRYLLTLLFILTASSCVHAQSRVKYLIESGYAGTELTPSTVDRADLLDAKHLARLGDRQAQFTTGAMYHALGDSKSAVYWYRRAALFHHPIAAHNLATMYYMGDGVDRDLEAAERWFLVAAEVGYPQSQTQLGIMTYRGEVDIADRSEADWYSMAAMAGDPFGQYNLGVLLFNGNGVDQDMIRALAWLRLANKSLSVDDAIQTVVAALEADDIAQADQLAGELEEEILPPVFRG